MGRRERNKLEKLRRITSAAKELFATKGFAQTTTQEIAERADIGTGTLFLYAKSKEDLLIMVFKDEMIETSQAAFRKISSTPSLIDQLMEVFGSMIAYHNRDVGLAKVLIKEITILASPERRNDLRELMKIVYDGIGDLIVSGQKAGKIRASVDPQTAAENLFGIYYINLIGWLGGMATKRQFLSRLRPMLTLAIEGLAADRREAPAPRAKALRKA